MVTNCVKPSSFYLCLCVLGEIGFDTNQRNTPDRTQLQHLWKTNKEAYRAWELVRRLEVNPNPNSVRSAQLAAPCQVQILVRVALQAGLGNLLRHPPMKERQAQRRDKETYLPGRNNTVV